MFEAAVVDVRQNSDGHAGEKIGDSVFGTVRDSPGKRAERGADVAGNGAGGGPSKIDEMMGVRFIYFPEVV